MLLSVHLVGTLQSSLKASSHIAVARLLRAETLQESRGIRVATDGAALLCSEMSKLGPLMGRNEVKVAYRPCFL